MILLLKLICYFCFKKYGFVIFGGIRLGPQAVCRYSRCSLSRLVGAPSPMIIKLIFGQQVKLFGPKDVYIWRLRLANIPYQFWVLTFSVCFKSRGLATEKLFRLIHRLDERRVDKGTNTYNG